MNADKMLQSVALKLKPSARDAQEALRQLEFVRGRLAKVVPRGVEIGMMGSTAKGTSLADNREIDVFMLIPRSYPKDRMAKMGLEWAKKAMRGEKTEIGYANHPYLKVFRGGFKIDIVPSFKIENAEHLGSAVDRSQLHTVYVNARMTDAMRGDVRLLKRFAKKLGVYGAELKVEGFSGYLCELLVMRYGTFTGVLEAAAKWGEKPAVDMAGGRGEGELRKAFPDAPLIFIDPVDAKRNVAAVVSHTSLSRFVHAARKFLQKPSAEYFFKEKEVHSAAKLRKMILSRGTHTVALKFPAPQLVEDILWPQLRKTAQLLVRRLTEREFRPFGHYFWSDGKDAIILLELMEGELPAVRRRIGPAIWHKKDVDSFIATHKNAHNLHFEHERIVAVEKREIRTCEAELSDAITEGKKLGIPPEFAKALGKCKYNGAAGLLSGKYLEVASDYFSRRV